MIIEAGNINKSFGNVRVLKNVSLQIDEGKIVSIIGPSGAGKTTLLQILGTLLRPDNPDYTLQLHQTDIKNLTQRQLAKFRNKHIGFVFQFHNLLPEFTALENVAIPAYIAGKNKKEADESAAEWLVKLGLENRLHHKPSQLSGGEQQRVAVARALINDPAIILADEPSGNLDTKNARQLHELFLRIHEETGKTFVIVTHNMELADMSHQKLHMLDGRILQE